MSNLGIVIAVSDYSGGLSPLPGCKRDGEIIASILRVSGKFSHILSITEHTKSSEVKRELAEFVRAHQGKEIEEVFFYFSGHGYYSENELNYLLSDYSPSRLKSTSLENSEVDSFVRSLSPSLFVKMVDSCNSGVPYIKNGEDSLEHLKPTSGEFRKLYFMFSSNHDQSSYASEKISDFTENVVKSIVSHDDGPVRYKDIIDYVSDSFKQTQRQTPFFVTQADFTEVFCDAGQTLKAEIAQFLSNPSKVNVGPEKSKKLVDIVKRGSENYCTKAEAIAALKVFARFLHDVKLPSSLAELYNISVFEENSETPGQTSIGSWLKGKKGGEWFAKEVTELKSESVLYPPDKTYGSVNNSLLFPRQTPSFYVNSPPFGATPSFGRSRLNIAGSDLFSANNTPMLSPPTLPTIVPTFREEISGFSFTTEMPFNFVKIRLDPTLKNLAPEEAYIVPILSRSKLCLFWGYLHFEYVDWDSAVPVGKLRYVYSEHFLKDTAALEKRSSYIASQFFEFVEDHLDKIWNPDQTKPTSKPASGSKK